MACETQNIPLALDGRMLGESGTGVATYARSLLAALNALGTSPLRIVDEGGQRFTAAAAPERWLRWCTALIDRPRHLKRRPDHLWARDVFRLAQVHFDRHATPLILRASGLPGIVHWTYPLPIRIAGWINIYTVHDAIPLTHPHLTPIDGQRHRCLLRTILASGGHVLTVSRSAKRDIVASLGEGDDRIAVCPTGLDLAAPPSGPLPAGLEGGRFFLAVGSIEPRKNFLRLAEAHQASGTALPLVIAGPAGWRSDEIEPLLAANPSVIRLPYPPRDMLMQLMAQAKALLFPSLVEGFGLPIVEAMALGTPVMTSRGGATAEIAGDAALLIDPHDVSGMAEAIDMLDRDDGLNARLTAAGYEQTALFTTDRFAERLGEVHRSLLERCEMPRA